MAIVRAPGPTPKVLNVATALVDLAAAEDEWEPMTHLRLQKLLYYVQGWSLALHGEAMFTDRIEAWSHGPVVRSMYGVLRRHQNTPIKPSHINGDPSKLSSDELKLIQDVWRSYRGYSPTSLRNMSHNEAPWVNARPDAGPLDACDAEITTQSMRDFFRKLARQSA
jgi:uncharacterized phage-associated protein